MATVSVILNCFNQALYVAEAIESVLDQSYRDFELIAIDNGSSDDTPAILSRYKSNARVRLFLNRDNCSITRRFNQGLDAATGEFVSFLYSDDFYLPQKLELQVSEFRALSRNYGVVYCPGLGLNQLTGQRWRHGSVGVSGYVLKQLLLDYERGQINMVSPMIRRECFQRYRFYEDVFAEGEAIFFRLAMTYQFSFQDEPLAVLRDHEGNAGKAIKQNAQISLACIERLRCYPEFPLECINYLREYEATVLRNYGWQAMRVGGDVNWGRRCFARAMQVSWKNALHPRLIAGLGLSILPPVLRKRMNQWGDKVRNHPHNSVAVESFGGSME